MLFKFDETLKKWIIFALIIEDSIFTNEDVYAFIHPTIKNGYFWSESAEGISWGCWIGSWNKLLKQIDTKIVCPD